MNSKRKSLHHKEKKSLIDADKLGRVFRGYEALPNNERSSPSMEGIGIFNMASIFLGSGVITRMASLHDQEIELQGCLCTPFLSDSFQIAPSEPF